MGTKKTFITAAIASAAFAAVPTVASAAPSGGLEKSYDAAYERVVDAGGQPGRNIADDGVQKGDDARPATSAELRASLGTLRRMSAPAPTAPAATTGQAGATGTGQVTGSAQATTTGQATGSGQAAPAQSSGGGLEGVAACESGGDPGAVSPDGQYRGKYQFDQQTWESVGGSGDPASAPEAEQDQRAQQLQAQRGSSPWPVCGG